MFPNKILVNNIFYEDFGNRVQKAPGGEWKSGDVSAEVVFVLQLESALLLKSNF